MRLKLRDIAELVSGKLEGDPDVVIKGLSTIEEASETDLTFLFEKRFSEAVSHSKAAALLTGLPGDFSRPTIFVKNPRTAFALLLSKFAPPATPLKSVHKSAVIATGVHIAKTAAVGPNAVIGEGTRIGARSSIGALTYIGEDCEIGNDVVIFPHTTLLDRTVIRDRAVIWSGTVIGVDGFGFSTEEGEPARIPQIGRVVIEEDVEIFANCTVARATLGETRIGRNSKLDCMVHTAHNVRMGQNCMVAASVAIAGSVQLGDSVAVGGQSGFHQHVRVGDRCIIMARAGVVKDVPAHQVISGFPAQDHRQELQAQAHLRRLPEILKRIQRLEGERRA